MKLKQAVAPHHRSAFESSELLDVAENTDPDVRVRTAAGSMLHEGVCSYLSCHKGV
jgi:hypothetical protein